MFKYILKRIISLIPVVIIISIMLFGIMKMMPGDPVLRMMPGGGGMSAERYQELYDTYAEKLGVNKPIHEQYLRWVVNIVQGDLGYSSLYKQDVKDVIAEPLKNSIFVNFFSVTLSFLIAIPVGIRCATKRGGLFDQFWQVFSLIGISIPTFFIGLLLIYFLAFKLKIFPAGGMPIKALSASSLNYALSWLWYAALPILTLTIGSLAGTIRYVRSAMIDVINKDYIRTARAKGLSDKVIIYTHAFKNALIPVVTLVAGSIVALFGGASITEQIFSWNGIGFVLIKALNARDFQVVLAMNMFYAVISLLANLIMDISYSLVDPRVKLN
ncbi:MAG: ABC transporter permease [Anaerorhabdus sp.]